MPAAARSTTWSPIRTTTRREQSRSATTPNGRLSIGKSLASGTGIQVEPFTSKVAAPGLIALDRFEQRLEVAFAETFRTVPLNDLEEQCGPVGDRLCEDLQQIAVVVEIGEDVVALQLVPGEVERRHTFARFVVVALRHVHESHTPSAHRVDGCDDVVCSEGDVLYTGSVVLLDVLLNLALASPL